MHISLVPTGAALSNPRVLVIEGDGALASSLLDSMERAGFTAMYASTGTEGIALRDDFRPHVILMDFILPDIGGMALLSHLNKQRGCGFVVLADPNDEADGLVMLEYGADDYMVKPPRLRELVARIRAVHRRVSTQAKPQTVSEPTPILKVGPIRISALHRTVHTEDGRRLALTFAEFNALELLVGAAGAAVSRDELSLAALRRPWRAEDRSVDQLVFNLRRKLPAEEGSEPLIQSIRGCGYRMSAPDSASPREPVRVATGVQPVMAA